MKTIKISANGSFIEVVNSIRKQIQKYAEKNLPKTSITNDGIGSYEFWGMKCFDSGSEYVEIEFPVDPIFKATVICKDFIDHERLLDSLIDDVLYMFTGSMEGQHGDELEYKAMLRCKSVADTNDGYIIETVWTGEDV